MDNDKLKEGVEKALGISGLPEGVKEELLSKAGGLALERALAAIMEKVPENKRDELINLSKEGGQEKLLEFMKINVPKWEAAIKSEVQSVISEIKGKN